MEGDEGRDMAIDTGSGVGRRGVEEGVSPSKEASRLACTIISPCPHCLHYPK